MKAKLGIACWIGCLMVSSSALLVVGCGDDAKPANEAGGVGGDATGGTTVTGPGGEGNAEQGGSGPAAGGSGGSGARPNVDPGGPDGPMGPDVPHLPGAGGADDGGEDSPDFDGVDLEGIPEDAPSGCEGGFEAELGTLKLELGGDVSVARVAVHAGVIQANGVDCSSTGGDPARAEQVTRLELSGTEGDEVVYLDLSDEPFAGSFAGDGVVAVALGGGADRVVVLGTEGKDVFQLGTDEETLLIDVTGDDRADLSLLGSPAVLLSTGGEQDIVRGDGSALGIAPAALPLTVYGGGNRDALVGGGQADALFGGIGNDWFDAGAEPAGGDTFDGGDGTDTIDFSARTRALTLSLTGGKDDGEAGEDAEVRSNVENVYGGQGKNTLTGGDAGNHFWGGPEDDVLAGGGGDDTLSGGPGNDQLSGGPGYDFLYGEEGDDDLQGGTEDDLLDGFEGNDTLNGGPGDGDICVALEKADKALACEL